MAPVLTPQPLYEHPDGFTIAYGNRALIATDDDLNVVIVPIGRECMLELSRSLYNIATKMKE